MKMYYIANARMPNDKAHGIQLAKMCEAFIASGVDVTLVVSRGSGNLKEFYDLTYDIPLVRLPVLQLGYRLAALQFSIVSLIYVWIRSLYEKFVVYTIDMDSFSFAPLIWAPGPLFAEMHTCKKPLLFVRWFFNRAGIIATNQPIAEGLVQTFRLSQKRICIEPNGVDESAVQNTLSQREARTKLGLPLDESFALYVGRFYEWKGLEILADAALHSPLPIHIVGGTRGEYERVTDRSGETLHFAGIRPVSEVPLWLAAADVLLVLGTMKAAYSSHQTSPMKIFEYLATHHATVASRTPALQSIMSEKTAFWYEPDNTASLVQAIHEAYTSSNAEERIQAGRALAVEHTWRRRAERIIAFIHAYGN